MGQGLALLGAILLLLQLPAFLLEKAALGLRLLLELGTDKALLLAERLQENG